MLIVQTITVRYNKLMHKYVRTMKQHGFTLIEILIVMAIMGSLAVGYTYLSSRNGRDRAYLVRAESEVVTLANAVKLKVQETNEYPADVNRGLPPGIEEYISTPNEAWPDAPWPDTVYDYENWDGGDTIQISVRFCNPGDNATCKANAEKYLKNVVDASVLANWDANSAVYFCIKEGSCRSHSSRPASHPGYRIQISSAR